MRRFGSKLTITYDHQRPVTAVSIIPPGANTHSLNMMQRIVFLKITKAGTTDEPSAAQERGPVAKPATGLRVVTSRTVTVQLPTAADRVANPGYYMLWVLDGDVPCAEAAWIKLTM